MWIKSISDLAPPSQKSEYRGNSIDANLTLVRAMEGGQPQDTQQTTPIPVPVPPAGASQPGHSGEEMWGTKNMGPPAAPSAHPHNQQAAVWGVPLDGPHQSSYVLQQQPVVRSGSPMESILDVFNEWGKKTETLANNVWQNLRTGQSVTDAAWGKLSLGAKAVTEGGFESLYKHTFPVDPNDHLKKTFACYLSTAAGPVAGTLYLSNLRIAFCSDRPLSFSAPSGQEAWSYYKVVLPFEKVANVIPVTAKENPPEKYIQISTVDAHDFWFMGFVNYDKASTNLLESLAAAG